MDFRSNERTIRRYDEGDTRHRKRIGRRFPASQIVFGGHQHTHHTLRSVFHSIRTTIWLIHPFQESKDVEEKLGDLIPWLRKLKDDVMTLSADDSREEAERFGRLIRFLSCSYRLAD